MERPALLAAAFAVFGAPVLAQTPSVAPPEPPTFQIDAKISPPVLIHRLEPQYTEEAKSKHIEGRVIVRGIIGKDGTLSDVKVAQSLNPGLDQKAVEAVRQWKFTPASKGGKPVRVAMSVALEFKLPSAADPNFGAGAYREGEPGLVPPKPIKTAQPFYSSAAMREKIQGEVWIEAIVRPDGTVGDLRVVRSLDQKFGLDDAAVAAAKRWQFVPGKIADQPVPVLIQMVLEFRLH